MANAHTKYEYSYDSVCIQDDANYIESYQTDNYDSYLASDYRFYAELYISANGDLSHWCPIIF